MTRRRSLPWIHRYSRPMMGAIAVVGAIITSYLTYASFTGTSTVCLSNAADGGSSCNSILQSAYARIFGLPLSLFGLLAYIAMLVFALSPLFINPETSKKSRNQVEDWTWQLLFIGGTAMAVFSGYLMYIAFGVLNATCYYCIGSAVCSALLFILAIVGRNWEEMGQLIFKGIVVGMVTLVATLGLYANVNTANAGDGGQIPIPEAVGSPQPPKGWEITTTSGEAEITLAKHLTAIGAKEYVAYWCPHCYDQKQLFGKEAYQEIDHTECDPQGENANPQACIDAGIQGFPTWIINGQSYSGAQPLEKLAEISGYTGPMNFKYKIPGR